MRRHRWLILLVLFLARTAIALQFQTVGSLGSDLMRDYAIQNAALGTLIGFYMLPGVFMSLPAGLIGQRFGSKSAAILAMALMAIGGVITGLAPSFILAAAGRLISGMGAAMLNVILTRMVADWFSGREIVTAMSLLIVSWPLGIGIGIIAFMPLADVFGSAGVMLFVALLVVICLALIVATYHDPDRHEAAIDHRAMRMTRREVTLASLAGLIWGAYNVAFITFISFAPAYFATRGFSLAAANSLTSLVSWSLIASIPIGGLLAEQLRRPNLQLTGALATIAAAIVGIVTMTSTSPGVVLLACAFGLPAGLLMTLPTEVLGERSRAAGMGLFYSLFYLCTALLPGLAGGARDLWGSTTAPILFAAGLTIATLAGLLAFRILQSHQPDAETSLAK